MSNGCEYLRCEYWNGQAYTDPVYWVNYEGGASVCGKRDDAIHPDSKISELNKRIADLEAKLKAAEEMVENLKCCGNCKKRFTYSCPKPVDENVEGTGKHRFDNTPNVKCDAWQSDNLTQEERKC